MDARCRYSCEVEPADGFVVATSRSGSGSPGAYFICNATGFGRACTIYLSPQDTLRLAVHLWSIAHDVAPPEPLPPNSEPQPEEGHDS